VRHSLLVAAAVAAVALTVGGAGAGCGSPFGTFDQFCDAFAAAQCKKYVACPSVPQPLQAECQHTVSGNVCYCFDAAMQNHEETYHADAVQKCLDAIAAESCTDAAKSSPPAVCSLVYGLTLGEAPHCPIIIGPIDGGP
jgi:hypothetical protein